MTLLRVLGVLMVSYRCLLLAVCDTGSADETFLVGLTNTSDGVVASLVPSNNSLSSPTSFLVANYFVPAGCGTQSFRCGNPLALPPATVSGSSSVQYIVLAPVTGAVLIMDLRFADMKMKLSSYFVKEIVGNLCDPISIFQAATGTVYMVCEGAAKLFLHTINLNTSSISSTTIPGYLLEYGLYQSPYLLSNFVYNGATLVYFLDGNSLHSFDTEYIQTNDYQLFINPCNSSYRATAVGAGSSRIVAMCEDSSSSAIIDTNAGTFVPEPGYVYPCTDDTGTWFSVYRSSDTFNVAANQYNKTLTVNGADFHSAICVVGNGYTGLVTLAYFISEAAYKITVFNGNALSTTLSLAIGCSPSGCGLEVFTQYLLVTGGDGLVFVVQNGSIGPDPVIDRKQLNSDINVLFRIPINTTPAVLLPNTSTFITSRTALFTSTPAPSGINNEAEILTQLAIGVIVAILVGLMMVVMLVVAYIVKIKCQLDCKTHGTRSLQCSDHSSRQADQQVVSTALHPLGPQNDYSTRPEWQQLLATETSGSALLPIPRTPETGSMEENHPSTSVATGSQQASSDEFGINTVPKEAFSETCGLQKEGLVTGTALSVPYSTIHPQNLMDQSPSEDRLNQHQSAINANI